MFNVFFNVISLKYTRHTTKSHEEAFDSEIKLTFLIFHKNHMIQHLIGLGCYMYYIVLNVHRQQQYK